MTHDTTPVVGHEWIDADGMKVKPVELMGVGGVNGLYVRVNDGAEIWWPKDGWDRFAANARRVG